jgi:hypothetical protein
VVETCPKIAALRPALVGHRAPWVAIKANRLPTGGLIVLISLALPRLFTIPSVSHLDLVRLVRLVRTFLQASLELTTPQGRNPIPFSIVYGLRPAEKLNGFEGYKPQLVRKDLQTGPALAAEGRFLLGSTTSFTASKAVPYPTVSSGLVGSAATCSELSRRYFVKIPWSLS